MLPKKGDIGVLKLGPIFNNDSVRNGWGKLRIISSDFETGVVFELIDSYNWLWYGADALGSHMFENSKYGTWTAKENNVLNLLKRVDEVSQGTT